MPQTAHVATSTRVEHCHHHRLHSYWQRAHPPMLQSVPVWTLGKRSNTWARGASSGISMKYLEYVCKFKYLDEVSRVCLKYLHHKVELGETSFFAILGTAVRNAPYDAPRPGASLSMS